MNLVLMSHILVTFIWMLCILAWVIHASKLLMKLKILIMQDTCMICLYHSLQLLPLSVNRHQFSKVNFQNTILDLKLLSSQWTVELKMNVIHKALISFTRVDIHLWVTIYQITILSKIQIMIHLSIKLIRKGSML